MSWSIAVVNHTWLEDCFAQWKNLTTTNPKYSVFPPGVDYSKLLTNRNLHGIGWDPAELEALETLTEEDVQDDVVERDMEVRGAMSLGAQSIASMKEVEDAVTMFDADADGDGASAGPMVELEPQRKRPPSKAQASAKQTVDGKPRVRRKSIKSTALLNDSSSDNDVQGGPGRQHRRSREEPVLISDNEPGPSNKGPQFTSRGRMERHDSSSDDEQQITPRRSGRISGRRESAEREVGEGTALAPKEPTTPSRKRASSGGVGRTPRREVSVVVPTVTEAYSPQYKRKLKEAKDRSKKDIERTESISVQAAEASTRSPHRPLWSSMHEEDSPRKSALQPKSPSGTTRAPRATSTAESLAAYSGHSAEMVAIRTPSKRSAANKAMKKLHDVIMPDVVSFQKEMKRGAVRSAWEDVNQRSAPASAKKGKARNGAAEDKAPESTSKGGSKKRMSVASAEEPESEGDRPVMKKQRTQHSKDAPTGRRNGVKKLGRTWDEEEGTTEESDEGEQRRTAPAKSVYVCSCLCFQSIGRGTRLDRVLCLGYLSRKSKAGGRNALGGEVGCDDCAVAPDCPDVPWP